MRSGCYERVNCNLVLVMAASLTYQHQHLTEVRYNSSYSSQSLTIGRQECLSAHLKIARWLDTIIVAYLVDTWSDRRNDVTRSLCAIFNWPRQGRVLSPPADRERTLETRLWPLPLGFVTAESTAESENYFGLAPSIDSGLYSGFQLDRFDASDWPELYQWIRSSTFY